MRRLLLAGGLLLAALAGPSEARSPSGLPGPILDFDFVTHACADYGFTNARTGIYYAIGADGNYAQVAANTCADFNYSGGGSPALGIGVWGPYTNNIRNNSMQGASVSTSSTNLATNGNFALNPINAAQNTVQNGWSWFSNGTGTVTWNGSDTVTIAGDGTHVAELITQAITVVSGQGYTVTLDVGTNSVVANVGTTAGGNNVVGNVTVPVGTAQTFVFTPSSTTVFLTLVHTPATSATIKNISIVSGSQPTNWDIQTGAVNAGTITAAVSALGTQNGIDTITETIAGTSAGAGVFPVCFDTNTIRTATTAQAWITQAFLQISGGDLTNISSIGLGINENTSTGAIVRSDQTAITVPSTGNYAGSLFVANFVTSGGATVARMQPCVFVNYSGAAAVNVSLKIGWPMTLQSTTTLAHPPIRTTNAAVAVQQDNISVATAALLPANISALVAVTSYMIPAATTINGDATFTIDDGTTTNRYEASVNVSGSNGGGTGASITQGGVTKAVLDGQLAPWPRLVMHCSAVKFTLDGVANAVDGSYVVNKAGGSTPLSLTTFRLGRISGGTDPLNGYIQRIRVYIADPSDAALSAYSRRCWP